MIQRYIAPKIKEHLATHNILLLLGTRGVQKFELVASCIENHEDILEIDASKKKVRKEIEALKSNGYLPYFGDKKFVLIFRAVKEFVSEIAVHFQCHSYLNYIYIKLIHFHIVISSHFLRPACY